MSTVAEIEAAIKALSATERERLADDYRAVAQRFEGDLWVWVWIGSHKDFDRQFPA